MPPRTQAERFAGIIEGLCRAVAARGGGRDRLAGPLVVLIWTRLRRIAAQVVALAARVEAGRHRRYPSRRPPLRTAGRPAVPRRHAPPVLPHGFAWLLPLVPCEAAGYASQLRYLLAEPEVAALVDAAPQMRRLLRPLCRMLGVSLPPPPRPPAEPAPARSLPAGPALARSLPAGPPAGRAATRPAPPCRTAPSPRHPPRACGPPLVRA